MNDELQKELAAWLASMRDGAQQGMNFALEQAPLVVQEKVLYGRLGSLVGILGCVCVIAVGCYLFWRVGRPDFRENEGTAITVNMLSSFAVLGAMAFLFAEFIPMALKSWFAPRLYVLEWLAEMLK